MRDLIARYFGEFRVEVSAIHIWGGRKPIFDSRWTRKSFVQDLEGIKKILISHPTLTFDYVVDLYHEKKGTQLIRHGSCEGYPQYYWIFTIDHLIKYVDKLKCTHCSSYHEEKCTKLRPIVCFKCKTVGHHGKQCRATFEYDGRVKRPHYMRR